MARTVEEWLQGLANATISTEEDSIKMQTLLIQAGFPNARVVLGVAYLEGKGTIECPPTSIHSVAKMIVEQLPKQA